MTTRKTLGFTLIEVITVVMIIGILAAIAYPSYLGMMQRTRRAEAATILNEQQLRLEKFRVDNADYADYVITGVNTTQFYDIELSDASPTSYTLTATPKGSQAKDDCGTLSLSFDAGTVSREDESGGTEDCW
jgi:type IV pilus assembly protein PilE